MNQSFAYVGSELDLFAAALRWKNYLRRQIQPYLSGAVLEVGAGFGGTTRVFCPPDCPRWVCLEPDPELAGRIDQAIDGGQLPACCQTVNGDLEAIADEPAFDAILYIDVLEHIDDDRAEVARALRRLRPGGRLVVLSPAHQWLYTPFDQALGHFRRYTKATLRAVAPPGLELRRLVYLDAAGLLASLGNRLVLKLAMPTKRQIAFWDNVLVRLSRVIDPLLGYLVGKSVLAVWQLPSVRSSMDRGS